MKKLRKLIALSLSLAMMSLTSASIFSVNAEEITEAVYYSESETQSEPVLTTATTNPLPVVIETEAEFADGAVIDFQGSSVKDFDRCCIEFPYLSEDFLESEGYIVFEVVLNDIIYYVNFPYELYSDVLHMNFNEDYYNMYACCVGWSGNYSSYVSEMEPELASEIYEEVKKCTYAILEIHYVEYKETTTTTTTTTTAEFPEDIHTLPEDIYTHTTTAPAVTTTATEVADTVTETTTIHLVNTGYAEEEREITVPVFGVQGTITVTSTVGSDNIAEVVRIDYSENMANIHIRGISSGIAEFNVSDENGYSENFTVQVVPQGYTFPQDTSTTTSISGQPATSGLTDNDIPIFYGDVNCDGYIDIADVVTVSAYVADPEQNYLGSPEIISGDVHNKGDGITSGDVLMIQQFLAGIITSL